MRYRLRRQPITDWQVREGRTFSWLAQRLGVKPGSLAHQLSGRCGVSLGVALKLEKELGRPVSEIVEEIS